MQKQSKLSDYMNKKTIKKDRKPKGENAREKHSSSRENSVQTQRLPSQSDVKLEVYGVVQHRSTIVCPAFILITPPSLITYTQILNKMKKIENNYGKQQAISFIEGNMRYHKISNIKFLQNYQDDDFWCITLPSLFGILISNIDKIDQCIHFLLPNTNKVLDLSKRTVFVLLICMFFGIMPKQPHQECVTFGMLMIERQNQSYPAKAKVRREKLKCIINYFKMVVKNQCILDEDIRIHRVSNNDVEFMNPNNYERYIPLRRVNFQILSEKTIQDYCGKAVMIDFANKKIGGGVLKNGCVQEQILFTIFPEAIVTKLLCPEMEQQEAIIIYGARRYSDYRGYSDTFQFAGSSKLNLHTSLKQSALVAIDAIDFSKTLTNFQYSKRGIRRQINKAFAGFQGVGLQIEDNVPICTGKWGCGAFGGDQDLKFFIQWIACSEAGRQMIYILDSKEKLEEYLIMVQQLNQLYTLDLINILDEYFKVRTIVNNKKGLLQYMKNYI